MPDNVLKEIAKGSGNVNKSFLGPEYKYYDQIKSPSQLGISSTGSMSALATNVGGIINYVQLLVEGGGRASKTGGLLGNRFFLKTPGKCKDVATKKVVPRYVYVDNIPSGNIPIISSGLGKRFNEFRGLVPGAIENVGELNPVQMFGAFMEGSQPDCREVSYPVTDTSVSSTKAHISLAEIKEYNKKQNRAEAFIAANNLLARSRNPRKHRVSRPTTNIQKIWIGSISALLLYILHQITWRVAK